MSPAEDPDALREQQRHELLQAGLDRLDQGITVFDADLRMVAWNRAFLQLLDFPGALAQVGASFESFIRYNAERGEYGPGPIDAQVAERVGKARTFQSHDTERNRPNGQIIAVRGEPLPHNGFVTLYTDITSQRRYERLISEQNAELERRVAQRTAELQRSNDQLKAAHDANQKITAALRRSEERLRLITDAVPALIAYFDCNQVYRYVNKGYADWFGHSKDRMLGRTIEAAVPGPVYDTIAPHVVTALQGQRVTYEYAMQLDPGGPVVHARSELVPEIGPGGEVLGCFVLSVNISELKAAQAARGQTQKMEAVVQLTGGLAHDFNNMLAVMIGNLAALRDRHPDDTELAEYLTPALRAAHSGATLIRRLLTFARQQPLAPRAVDVEQLITESVELLRHSLPEAVRITVRPPPEGPPVLALTDAHQLENALLNLAINARDAMPDGGELSIDTQPVHLGRQAAAAIDVAPGDYLRLSVTDTGIGMDSATQARVFEPFFTTKRFGSGSGLGLSMVYGFARQSGGAVILHSSPGAGTQVSLILPQAHAQHRADTHWDDVDTAFDALLDSSAQPPGPRTTPHPGTATAQPHRPLVLLVEDNTELRRVIRLQLVAMGYPVIEAGDGHEALEVLETVPDIGLLVSDVVMPGSIDGRELCERASQTHPDMRKLLISGYADDPAPAPWPLPWPLLRKPFSSAELGDALEGLHR